MQRKIPKIVWQTWKTKDLAPHIADERNRMIRENPGYNFQLWDDGNCEDFMRQLTQPISDAYFSINPVLGAARADLWRYCVIHKFGGIYLDLDASIEKPLDSWIGDTDSFIVFADQWTEFTPLCEELLELIHFPLQTKPQNLTHKRLAQFIIISEPRHVFLEEVIYRVTHTLNNYFDLLDKTDYSTGGMLHTAHKIGYKLHTMTGPGVWTNCIRKVLNEHDVHFKFIDEDGRYSATNFMIGKKFGTPSSWEDYEGSLKSIAHSKK